MLTLARRALSSSAPKIERAIDQHTRTSRDHLTPELALHLLTPDCPLYEAEPGELQQAFGEPFWAIYWPGGQALARFLLDNGAALVGGKKVLDIGTGCGAAAIAAKLAGAKDVLANDTDEVACIAARKNAKLNGVEIRTSTEDLIGRKLPEPFDFILFGDMLYDEAMASRLEAWLDEHVANREKTTIYLADPGRHGLTRELRAKLQLLKTYQMPANVMSENHGFDKVGIWKLLRQPGL